MQRYYANIEQATKDNNFFRKVLYTGKHMQLVVMSLKPSEEIGMEVHENVDQFFRIEEGNAKFVIEGEELNVQEDEVVIIPAGSQHNVINNSSSDDLKIYTIYAPPNHPEGTVHETKEGAEKHE